MAAYRATMVGSCLGNDCVARGSFCRESTRQCDSVNSATVPIRASGRRAASARRRRVAGKPAVDGVTGRLRAPTLVDHRRLRGVRRRIHGQPSTGVYLGRRLRARQRGGDGAARLAGLRHRERIVGLFAAKEVRDVKVCEALARSRSGVGIGWHLGPGLCRRCANSWWSPSSPRRALALHARRQRPHHPHDLDLAALPPRGRRHPLPARGARVVGMVLEHAASLGAADLHTISGASPTRCSSRPASGSPPSACLERRDVPAPRSRRRPRHGGRRHPRRADGAARRGPQRLARCRRPLRPLRAPVSRRVPAVDVAAAGHRDRQWRMTACHNVRAFQPIRPRTWQCARDAICDEPPCASNCHGCPSPPASPPASPPTFEKLMHDATGGLVSVELGVGAGLASSSSPAVASARAASSDIGTGANIAGSATPRRRM